MFALLDRNPARNNFSFKWFNVGIVWMSQHDCCDFNWQQIVNKFPSSATPENRNEKWKQNQIFPRRDWFEKRSTEISILDFSGNSVCVQCHVRTFVETTFFCAPLAVVVVVISLCMNKLWKTRKKEKMLVLLNRHLRRLKDGREDSHSHFLVVLPRPPGSTNNTFDQQWGANSCFEIPDFTVSAYHVNLQLV